MSRKGKEDQAIYSDEKRYYYLCIYDKKNPRYLIFTLLYIYIYTLTFYLYVTILYLKGQHCKFTLQKYEKEIVIMKKGAGKLII